MSYSQNIRMEQLESRSKAVATKIRDMMQDLRLSSNENVQRRWIWELLQNAKDVSVDGKSIDVEIELDLVGNTLKFSHNGRPFTSKNITFLIEQTSSKDQVATDNSTGKFGTGFLTTHLLSEVVTLTSLIKDKEEPYKKFTLSLDRSGRDVDSIISSIDDSFAQLTSVENSDEVAYYANNMNTTFEYQLDFNGIEVAKTGIDDLVNLASYVLLFIPELNSIFLKHSDHRIYKNGSVTELSNGFKVHEIIHECGTSKRIQTIVVGKSNDVEIAVEVEMQNEIKLFKSISNKIPKLFCDFPLIGTESFPLPVIVNNSKLNPTEPRDGVFLTDKDDPVIVENKDIIKLSLELVFNLIDLASSVEWKNTHELFRSLKYNITEDWISNDWLCENIEEPLESKLLSTTLVDTQTRTRRSILKDNSYQVLYPNHERKEIRYKLYDLAEHLSAGSLCNRTALDDWHNMIPAKHRKLTVKLFCEHIKAKDNLNTFAQGLCDTTNSFDWLNQFYLMLSLEGKFVEEIISDKYQIIPNQNGSFKLYSELYVDDGIAEELKDILKELGEDCREYLIDSKIELIPEFKNKKRTTNYVISQINTKLEKLNRIDSGKAFAIAIKLISLFPTSNNTVIDDTLFNYYSTAFSDTSCKKIFICNYVDSILEKAVPIAVRNITKKIASYENLNGLQKYISMQDEQSHITWLDNYVNYLVENNFSYLLDNSDFAILPNQNYNFDIKDNLYLDDGIDDELKDICLKLGYDFRHELLIQSVYLELPESRTKSIIDISEKVTFLIKDKLNDLMASASSKYALKELLLWFNNNEDKARTYFSDLWKSKHRLLDDEEIIESLDKASKYDELMQKLGIDDECVLERIIDSYTTSTNISVPSERILLTKEVLAQMGISSEEELAEAFENPNFASMFTHDSDNNYDKFEYVNKIIDRSIHNVFQHLKNNCNEYDLSNPDEISRTIFTVEKNGEEIYLLIRPSDYDQVIIYYDSEKDILDYEKDVELWTDNDITTPQKLTFGKILKITGINKLPLKKVHRWY